MILAHIRIAGCWVWRWISRAVWAKLPHVAIGGLVVTCVGIPAALWRMTPPAPVAEPVAVAEPGTLGLLAVGVGMLVVAARR